MTKQTRDIKSVALVNTLPDYGIDTYTYELGEALAENGISVDSYRSDVANPLNARLHPLHRRFNVLGGRLPKELVPVTQASVDAVQAAPPAGSPAMHAGKKEQAAPPWKQFLRNTFLSWQLALHMKRRGYDLVWTHWPDAPDYSYFWFALRRLGIQIVHSVHNVLPHERDAGDIEMCGNVYEKSDVLISHSHGAREELARIFPSVASKAIVGPLGAFTVYSRLPDAREEVRSRLSIPANAIVVLFCGAVRPYKNLEAIVKAMALQKRDDLILVVAGSERIEKAGDDRLAGTRRLVEEAGLESCTRLVPGYMSEAELSAMLEASDILMLPYLHSDGSGLLSLGIAFGKHIVVTRPGMEETAAMYPRSVIIDDPSAEAVSEGITTAVRRIVGDDPLPSGEVPDQLVWKNIAASWVHGIATAGRS